MLALLLQLALCAWAPKPAHVDVRSIGIIAAVGDTCMFERVGSSRFEWLLPPQASFLEISDWGIDDDVTNFIAASLGTHYRVQSIAIEHQDFDTWTYDSLSRLSNSSNPEAGAISYGYDNNSNVLTKIAPAPNQTGTATVTTTYTYDVLNRLRNKSYSDNSTPSPSFIYDLVDPWGTNYPFNYIGSAPKRFIVRAATQNDLTDAQRETLHRDFLQLLDATLPDTLRQLGLKLTSPP